MQAERQSTERDDDVLQRLLEGRYSCRAFQSRPVPQSMIERLLFLAQKTPSWCNTQPWHLHITSGAATERFRTAMYDFMATKPEPKSDLPVPREYRGISLARRRECGAALYDSVGIARGDKEAYARQSMENFRLFGAPHVAIMTTDEPLGVYGAVDCGAYVSSFVLAAQSLGLATIPQAALAIYGGEFVRNYFKIAEDRLLVCGISFGYADTEHPVNRFRTTRARFDEAATFYSE